MSKSVQFGVRASYITNIPYLGVTIKLFAFACINVISTMGRTYLNRLTGSVVRVS